MGTEEGLNQVFALGPDQAYIVGARGLILRFDGHTWQRVPSVSKDGLYAIWGSRRRDGSVDLWLAGQNGMIARGDGQHFEIVRRDGKGDLLDIWGYNPDGNPDPEVVWAAGKGCSLVTLPSGDRYSGAVDCSLLSVWGTSPQDVWTSGTQGIVYRFRGDGWDLFHTGRSNEVLTRIWGTGPADVWFVGLLGQIRHFDGSNIAPVGTGIGELLRGVFAVASDDIWAVGEYGTVRRYQGAAWIPVPLDTGLSVTKLRAVWASGPRDVWMAGESTAGAVVLHHDGTAWKTPDLAASRIRYTAVWGTGPGDVWVGGSAGTLIHYGPAGVDRKFVDDRFEGRLHFTGIAGSSAKDMRAVGVQYGVDGSLEARFSVVWDGATVVSGPAPTGFPAAVFFCPGVGYVTVGRRLTDVVNGVPRYAPYAARLVAGAWQSEPVEGAENPLLAVFGTGPSDLIATDEIGNLVRRDMDGTWRSLPRVASDPLTSIHGLPSGEAWAVGIGGAILHRAPASP